MEEVKIDGLATLHYLIKTLRKHGAYYVFVLTFCDACNCSIAEWKQCLLKRIAENVPRLSEQESGIGVIDDRILSPYEILNWSSLSFSWVINNRLNGKRWTNIYYPIKQMSEHEATYRKHVKVYNCSIK